MRGAGKFFIIIYCYYKLSFETLPLLLKSTHSARVNIVFRVGDDYEYTGGSGDGYQRSSKRSYHGSSSGGAASASSYHPYRR